MAQAAEEDEQDRLFTKLQSQLQSSGSYKKALKTVDEILKILPGDVDALTCKAVILVQTSKFEEALQLLESASQGRDSLPFEQAYSLYRLGRYEEALEAVQAVDDANIIAKLQLQAQLQYRLAQNKEAIKSYSQLFQQHKVESFDLRTNVLAAYVSGGRAVEIAAVMGAMQITADASYEIGFNKACGLLDLGDFQAAEDQLQLALRLGRETLFEEEELGEEAAEEELAPLQVQLAYARARLGRNDQAVAALEAVLGLEADRATLAVAQNNLTALRSAAMPPQQQRKFAGEALKKLDALMERPANNASLQLVPALESRLSDAQKEGMHANRALLLLAGGKPEAARQLHAALAARYPHSPHLQLLDAAISTLSGDPAAAAAALSVAGLSPDASVAVQASLMQAQLAVAAGDLAAGLAALQALQGSPLWQRPAVIATVVHLMERLGRLPEAEQRLKEALQWWRGSKEADKGAKAAASQWLLKAATEMLLKGGKVEEAAAYFAQLQAAGAPPAVQSGVLVKLAEAFAVAGRAGAEQLEAQLPSISGLPSAKVDGLENAVLGTAMRRQRKDEIVRKRDAEDEQVKQTKKRRKKKPRLPKGFDPANPGPPPDPERWLPKWQRAEFRKKRNRRKDKEAAVKGSQGAGKVDEALDRTGDMPEAPAAAKAAPRPPGLGPPGRKKKGRR